MRKLFPPFLCCYLIGLKGDTNENQIYSPGSQVICHRYFFYIDIFYKKLRKPDNHISGGGDWKLTLLNISFLGQ